MEHKTTSKNSKSRFNANGPLIQIDSIDIGPAELAGQLPIQARLARVLIGPDRPDYCLAVLEKPLTYSRESKSGAAQSIQINLVILCARLVGQQIAPTMKDLFVNIAYVLDETLYDDPTFEFAKAEYVACGTINIS